MCERWVRDWKNCNILTPISSGYCSTSFSFCTVLLNRESWGPIALCWELVLSTASYLQLLHRVISLFDIHLLHVSVASAPNLTRPQSRLYPDIFDRMHLFVDWRLGRRSICYTYSCFFFCFFFFVFFFVFWLFLLCWCLCCVYCFWSL